MQFPTASLVVTQLLFHFQSASVLEAVKKDLDELTTAVKTEATNAGSAIADTLNVSHLITFDV